MGKPLGTKREVIRIPQIIASKGWYQVHFARYRDENSRRAIKILEKQGVICEDKSRREKEYRTYVAALDSKEQTT